MRADDNGLWNDRDEHSEQKDHGKPTAYRLDDDDNLEEKDLKTHYLFGEGKMKSVDDPGMEGQGMGGEKFGQNSLTPAGRHTGLLSRVASTAPSSTSIPNTTLHSCSRRTLKRVRRLSYKKRTVSKSKA